jgi:hypothetical protein
LPEGPSTSVPAATSSTDPDPSTSVPAATSMIVTNVTATAMAINTNVSAPSAVTTGPEPINIQAGETTNHTPAPLANLAPILMAANTDLPTPSQDETALHLKLQAAKLKLNVALLHKKLQEAKAQQLNLVLAGNIVDKQHPQIAKIGANEAKGTEHTKNPGVHEPTVSAHPQVFYKRE